MLLVFEQHMLAVQFYPLTDFERFLSQKQQVGNVTKYYQLSYRDGYEFHQICIWAQSLRIVTPDGARFYYTAQRYIWRLSVVAC